jgi:hypothetical protein
MLSSRFIRNASIACLLAAASPGLLLGQGTYATNGTEYAIAGTLPGEQVHPSVAVTTNGGFLVWEDNVTDGYGLGVSAIRLDSSFSQTFAPFRVNAGAAGDQEQPHVTLLGNGGAAFVWQGGQLGFQHIYARFLSSSNTWLANNDLLVNSATNSYQLAPAIATLANGSVVVVYVSLNQSATNSMADVYGQILSPTGQPIGSEFLVNQFTPYNQRAPGVAALAGGGFVVVWVSEQERSGAVDNNNPNYLYAPGVLPSVDIYARMFNASGAPVAGEFLVNTSTNVCANPSVAGGSDGGFLIAWGERNPQTPVLSWDISARPFSSAGVGANVQTVNTYLYGDQYAPQVSASGTDYLVVWTSLGQDGSREGVFGQFLRGNGATIGGELQVNTTTMSQQMQPTVASDGNGRFLAVWTSYVGGAGSFDLYAQRYVNLAKPLVAMNPPFVYVPFQSANGSYVPQFEVSWPFMAGFPVDHYLVYVDGAMNPAASLTTNIWIMTGITPGSTHSFQVAYVTTDGHLSPLSQPVSATTWIGYSWGGIPFEWMSQYYGGQGNVMNWPSPNTRLSPGGPTLMQVWASGGNPLDSSTWLRTRLVHSPQGFYLFWNPQPGFIYQVQASADLNHWANFSVPRFAAGTTDSLYVGVQGAGYYRVLLMR